MTDFTPEAPKTRRSALEKLDGFLPKAKEYHSRRNFVIPGHGNVSQLSPALRHRLLTEYEVLERLWDRYEPGAAETFEKEVWWRVYWKGWLEKRPSIWKRYRTDLTDLDWSERACEVISGKSGVEIIDYFTGELIETGYMHNHARMWWAAWWIHEERLPWQLGADFFQRHLLDGDAASNTLSWRWVAGLHTKGKEYLARRSNLEKFIAPEILDSNRAGLERLENPVPAGLLFEDPPTAGEISESDVDLLESIPEGSRVGVWIHDEDLHLESSPLSRIQPQSLAAFFLKSDWEREQFSESKQSYLEAVTRDGGERASNHFSCPCEFVSSEKLAETIGEWARRESIDFVVSMRPFTGLLQDQLEEIASGLEEAGISLLLFRRPEDSRSMNFATAGFFSFWKKTTRFRSELYRERNCGSGAS